MDMFMMPLESLASVAVATGALVNSSTDTAAVNEPSTATATTTNTVAVNEPPTSTATITTTNTDADNEPPTVAVTTKAKRKPRTKSNNLQKNQKAVLNNDIFTFARPATFDKEEVEVDPGKFHKFYKHFPGQTRVRFQEVR